MTNHRPVSKREPVRSRIGINTLQTTTTNLDTVVRGKLQKGIEMQFGMKVLAITSMVAVLNHAQAQTTINGTNDDDKLTVHAESGEPQHLAPSRPQDPDAPIYGAPINVYFLGHPFKDPKWKMRGRKGSDVFEIRTYISAKPHIAALHADGDGVINWAGVAGENTYQHDHWVDTFGEVDILDFNADEDSVSLYGHTISIGSVEQQGSHTIITVISQQGDGGGAHDEDILGTIRVKKTRADDIQIDVNAAPTDGIAETLGEFLELVEYYDDMADTLNLRASRVRGDGLLFLQRPVIGDVTKAVKAVKEVKEAKPVKPAKD